MYGVYDMTEEGHKMLDKQLLDNLVEERGIEVIREYLKEYDKTEEKRQRVNTMLEVASVYYEYKLSYRTEDALDMTAEVARIDKGSVEKHRASFNKIAIKEDFLNFAIMIDELINSLNQNTELMQEDINEIIKKEAFKYRINFIKAKTFFNFYLSLRDNNERIHPKYKKLFEEFQRNTKKFKTISPYEYGYLVKKRNDFIIKYGEIPF